MIKFFKNILLLGLTIFLFAPTISQASTISLSPASVVVHEGQSFNITVNANAPTTREYTVKMDMVFTPNVVRLSTWDFGSQWTVLRQPGYDSFDNAKGSLIRTGGYPAGFTGSVRFGTATFVAGKPGKGTISLTNGSFVFNEASQNTYTGANVVNIEVLPAVKKEPVVTEPKIEPVIQKPVVLKDFDLALVLDKPVFRPGDDITALLHLTNLSSSIEPLDVPLRYRILSTGGAVVLENNYGPVELKTKNNRYAFKVGVVDLPPGIYSISAEVAYDDLEKPAISVAHFRIEGDPVVKIIEPKYSNLNLIYIALALLLGLLVGMLIARYKHLHRHEVVLVEEPKKTRKKKKESKDSVAE